MHDFDELNERIAKAVYRYTDWRLRLDPVPLDVGAARDQLTQIVEKLRRYMDGYKRATRAELPEYRRIYFVSENEPRRAEIGRLIDRLEEGERKYFRSVLLEAFPASL